MVVDAYRTAPLPTRVSGDTVQALHDTAEQYYYCQNQTTDFCWPDQPKKPSELITTKREVRDEIYARLKRETDLNANLVQAAIKQTVENIAGLKTDWKKGRRISKPKYDSSEEGWSVLFDKRSSTFRKWKATLSLVDGNRHETQFILPESLDTPYGEYVLSDVFEYQTLRIVYRPDGPSAHEFYAHVQTRAEVEPAPLPHPDSIPNTTAFGELVGSAWQESIRSRDNGSDTQKHQRVLGVDRSVTGYSVVTSAGGFHGSADHLNHRRTTWENTRAGLQQTGTRSAHRTLQSVKGREWRWFDQLAHSIANAICVDVIRVRATHVVFERLLDIRQRISNKKEYQQWFFKRVEDYVEYKLEPYDVVVDDVSGAYTSQACSRMDCSHVARSNRSGNKFECGACGYALDADLNAAKNVAYRYVREEFHGDSVADGENWFDVVEQAEEADTGVSEPHKSSSGRAASEVTGDVDSQPAPMTTIVLKSGLVSLDGRFARQEWPQPATVDATAESRTSPTRNEATPVAE
ncbi:transposase [Natronomonas gomsonensis]|nr:transposase [Natronomonas gomsonensis]